MRFSVIIVLLLASLFVALSAHASCVEECSPEIKSRKTAAVIRCLRACRRNAAAAKASDAALDDASFSSSVLADSEQSGTGMITQEELWSKYRTNLLRALTRGTWNPSTSYLMLLTSPIEANWDTENPQLLQQIADTVPYWSEYYEPSQFSISRQYQDFVENVNAGTSVQDAGAKAEVDRLQAEIESAAMREKQARMQCFMQWKMNGAGRDYLTYEAQSCPNVAAPRKEAQEAAVMIEFWTTIAYGYEASQLIMAKTAVKGPKEYEEVFKSLASFRADIAKGVRNSLRVSVKGVDQDVKSRKFSEVSLGLTRPSSLSMSKFEFLTNGKSGLQTRRDQFGLEVSFESYAVIGLRPKGDWFSTNVLSKYMRGPFIHGQRALVGKAGTMRLRPSKLYVAYRPRFAMTLDKKDVFDFQNSDQKKSGGMFSSSYERVEIRTKIESNDVYKLELVSHSNVPQVVAIDFELIG